MEFDSALTRFSLVATAVQTIFVLKMLCLVFSHRHSMKERLRELAANLWACLVRSQTFGPSARAAFLSEQVQQHRFDLAPSYMMAGCIISQFVLVFTRVSLIEHGWALQGTYWTTLVICMSNICYLFYPGLLKKSNMNLWYSLHMAFCAVYLAPFSISPAQTLNLSLFLLGCVRLPSLLLATRISVVVLCNLMISILLALRIRFEDWAMPNCDLSDPTYAVLSAEVMSFSLTVLSAFVLDRVLHRKVSQDMRYTDTTTQLVAASSLLGLTCDAILELDSNLQIAEDSPQLAAMLLRDQRGSSVKGMPFTDLMPTKKEAARVVEHLSGKSGSSPGRGGTDADIHASAFHTRLVDSCSSKFRTEVFQVAYSQPDGVRHLVGLRDFTDQRPLAGNKAMDAMEEDPLASNPLEPAEVSRRRSHSASSRESGSFLDCEPATGAARLFLLIDMEALRVLASSLPMAIAAGAGLADLFCVKAMQFLQQAWQESVASARAGSTPQARSFQELELRWQGQTGCISGSLEVVKTSKTSGGAGFNFLMYFLPSLPSGPTGLPRSSKSSVSSKSSKSSWSPRQAEEDGNRSRSHHQGHLLIPASAVQAAVLGNSIDALAQKPRDSL